MGDKKRFTSSRKLDHLHICAEQSVECGDAGFGDIRFVHNALPECDMGTIDLTTRFLNHSISSPLFISAMTGGHPGTKEVNARLARAAERFGLGMGVGSQRAALEDPSLADTFSIVRDEAPHAFLVANLGAIQPEGDHNAVGCLDAIGELCREFKTPVIVKETGCGISGNIAKQCWGMGVSAIDIAGWGGTSWAAVESLRADKSRTEHERRLKNLGETFSEWGIPTVVSLAEVLATGSPVIVSGGVRSGLDMAKGLAFGADLCGMALPLLKPAIENDEALDRTIEVIHQELTSAMFLTGSARIADLRKARMFILGRTRQMIEKDNPARARKYH